MMIRRAIGVLAALVLGASLVACSGQGTGFLDPHDTVGGDDGLADGAGPADGAVVDADGVAPDGAPGADTGDVLSDALPDGGDSVADVDGDLIIDLVPDGGDPDEPWGPCDAGSPCSGGGQICLLLPGDEAAGVCVVPCSPGGGECPPSEECVVPDPDGAPENGYCFLPAGHLEPCDVKEGLVCTGGRTCLAPLAGGAAVCTVFCVEDESLCPDLTTCAPVTEEGVAEGWGACLPVSPLIPCAGDLACAGQEVCATPDVNTAPFLCLPSCGTPGAPCATGGTCTLLDGPGGEMPACVHLQGAAEWCDPLKGWTCAEERICLDVDDPTGFGRCAKGCTSDMNCASHEVCTAGVSPGGGEVSGCLPPSLAGPSLPACNPAWPCEPPAVCVAGACAAPCGDGCPPGQSCVDDGCVHASSVGHGCAPGWGWLCADGGDCSKDVAADSGVCAQACGVDGDCPPDEDCLPGPDGVPLCLTPVTFGGACSFSLGAACADGGHCMFLGSGAAGFCTETCPGIGHGGCPDGPAGTLSDCMLNSGGQTWCAFLCGPFGADCPVGMTCEISGVCLP
ncbi:MAG: hypothetical protein ABIK09_17800 [Pseudomonadota bacterium]